MFGTSDSHRLPESELKFVPSLRRASVKLAAILSSVDDAIEKTQAVIDQVQVVKRGLMQQLLTRGLPGRHTRFKQTEIGEIPEEWGVPCARRYQLQSGNGTRTQSLSKRRVTIGKTARSQL